MVDVTNEVQRLSDALGRAIVMSWTGATGLEARIVQTCPICRIELVVTFIAQPGRMCDEMWLHGELFSFYDQHHCTITDVMTLYEAAERELVRAGERMLALEGSDLRARAELESDRMAAVAEQLRRAMG
jgi:hypothetical protein